MRKNSLITLIIISLLTTTLFVNCKRKEHKSLKELQEEYIQPAEMILHKTDTDQVMSLVNLYLGYLQQGKVDLAMSMLYYLNKDSITSLPASLAKKERLTLTGFKGHKATVDHLIFLKETDSEVKYTLELFQKKPGDSRPNTISFIIKPVRRDGKWYLTLADTQSETQISEVEKFN